MPKDTRTSEPRNLTGREIAIIIASLRMIQLQRVELTSMPQMEGQSQPTLGEIDDLCEYINLGGLK